MKHWIPPFLSLCLLLLPANASAQAQKGDLYGTVVDYDGAMSVGDMEITGLPAVQKVRESAARTSLRARKKPSAPASGRRTNEPIRIVKHVDGATPVIRRAHRAKTRLKRVIIKGREKGSGRPVKYVLEGVSVSSYSVSPDGLRASISLNYEKCTPTYTKRTE